MAGTRGESREEQQPGNEGTEWKDSLHLQIHFFFIDMAVSSGIYVGESLFFSYQIKGVAVQTHEAEYWICFLHEQIESEWDSQAISFRDVIFIGT